MFQHKNRLSLSHKEEILNLRKNRDFEMTRKF